MKRMMNSEFDHVLAARGGHKPSASHWRRLSIAGAVLASIHLIAGFAIAATVSFRSQPPTPGPHDISNLIGTTSVDSNVCGGDDANYIADDRPVQGQSFTTGTNAAGYRLTTVMLREVSCETYALVPSLTYRVRVTRPAANLLEVIATETARVQADSPGNLPSINDGEEAGEGSGTWIAVTFDHPVLLQPNSTYGFDLGGGSVRHYWQTAGASTDCYKSGTAYSSGASGVGNRACLRRDGDRVFVVSLVPAESPPSKSTAEGRPAGR